MCKNRGKKTDVKFFLSTFGPEKLLHQMTKMYFRSLFLLLLTALCLSASAAPQRRTQKSRTSRSAAAAAKSRAKSQPRREVKQRSKVEEEQPTDPLTPDMLAATQRILVFDSLVVERKHLLRYLPLGSEQGRLTTYDDFFDTKGHSSDMLFLNGLGNNCIFARTGKDGQSQLYSSDMLGGKWSNAALLPGLNDHQRFSQMNYPFLMPDGVTLFFAAQSEDGLGGWDLYRSTYDASSGRYMKAESLGLPFCSTDDDLLYAVNETDSVGMLVSTRGQKRGFVCIYFFLPTSSHMTYDAASLAPEQLRALATLQQISLTSKGRQRECDAGKHRLKTARQRMVTQTADVSGQTLHFVVNDSLSYHRLSQFRSPGAAKRYQKIVQLTRQQQQYALTLNQLRQDFGRKATPELRRQILEAEQQSEQCQRDLKTEEKMLRNAENEAIVKH